MINIQDYIYLLEEGRWEEYCSTMKIRNDWLQDHRKLSEYETYPILHCARIYLLQGPVGLNNYLTKISTYYYKEAIKKITNTTLIADVYDDNNRVLEIYLEFENRYGGWMKFIDSFINEYLIGKLGFALIVSNQYDTLKSFHDKHKIIEELLKEREK